MFRNLFFFSSCILIIGACSTSEKPDDSDKLIPNEVKIGNQVCFNHSLLFLDSTTYEAVVNSEFIGQFAFSHEKQLTGFNGFYLIGKTNYIEFFHPKSIEGEEYEPGTIWICLASLKANYLKTLNKEKLNFIKLESDNQHTELSLMTNDSINPISTRELRKKQYESWTKKEYHDSISFLPVDYNSPQESDSSSNYLMNDVYGIGLSLNPDDSLKVIRYLKEIGYDSYSEFNGCTRISNNDQFIELHISKDNMLLSINRFYIQLNQSVERSTEVIGNSRIECDGKSAIWIFE
ncbi:MAG: hypothetical protein COA38_16455 [Fluviicola sp.]|nr:MAG: hypothetical protein COA38_16455 [Fluviicola sp.]